MSINHVTIYLAIKVGAKDAYLSMLQVTWPYPISIFGTLSRLGLAKLSQLVLISNIFPLCKVIYKL